MTSNEEELHRRIRELEREVAHWKSQIKTQRFGLNFLDIPEAFDRESEDKLPILTEVPECAIAATDDAPTHILIEGDNYHALTCLNYTHAGKVDVIYIDPPYNTGSDGFTYRDKRVQSRYPDGVEIGATHPARHSAWLSFMRKRLRLAKSLLSERGVIFISIDDNEEARLRLLCESEDLFDEKNFIAKMIWTQGKKHIGTFVGINHEYMLVYAKNKEAINDNAYKWHQRKEGLDDIYKEYNRLKKKHKDNYTAIEEGLEKFYNNLPDNAPALGNKHYKKVDARGIFFASDLSQGTGNGPRYEVLHPITGKAVRVPAGGWRYAYQTMQQLLHEDRIYFGDDETKVPCRKRYLQETEYELPSSVFYRDGRGATKEVETILGKAKAFSNPKDRREIARILNFRENSIILDFFAGSGTTLHATLQLNHEDGGRRQCILVQEPFGKEGSETNICRDITYERNRRVMQGYTDTRGNTVEGLGGSLRYYRTAFVGDNNAKNAHEDDQITLAQQAGCLIALAENTLEELTDLRTDFYQLFTDGKRLTTVYFQEDARVLPDLVELVRERALPTTAYFLTWNGTAEEFAPEFDGIPQVQLKAIPSPILEIYKKLLA